MSSDAHFDAGLLSPATAGHDSLVGDQAILDALVAAEAGLADAYADIGMPSHPGSRARSSTWRAASDIDVESLAGAAVAGGNPVIPLVSLLKERAESDASDWIHRGATSQDILDSAVMLVASRALHQVRTLLHLAIERLLQIAETRGSAVVAARTLTQHAVPTTVGLRTTSWARGLRRSADRLAALELPAQLGGAGGTLASFVEITGSDAAASQLVAAYARQLGLATPDAPWHVTRWPITELGDALVQSIDAVGKFAADVLTLNRTEIAEVVFDEGGGSSSMPQKRNPTEAVLIRSAAIRAPQLGATLHLTSSLASDERPDGAWHAEWPTLRELLRLALGASWHASSLAASLRFDDAAAARNLTASGGLIVAERLSIVLGPLLGPEAVRTIIAEVDDGADLRDAVRRALADHADRGIDVDRLIDPAGYTGSANSITADAVRALRRPEGGGP